MQPQAVSGILLIVNRRNPRPATPVLGQYAHKQAAAFPLTSDFRPANLILMNFRSIASILVPVIAGGVVFSACQPTRNFTTYFNLFYNMERIMDEVEEELLYIREMKTPEPVFHVPYDDLERKGSMFYPHLERRSMNTEEMRANKIKLDSILIKGSKLMARNAKSDYLDDGIFYIGKAYFYLREWYQSQQKCQELIDGFPDSKWQPDAHLVMAMDMLHQGNVSGAETMLSRAIDIAWAHRRRDILIEAFRLNADLQLSKGNVAEALRPYERAMLLSSDGEDRARWQYEMALIYYRETNFENALTAFNKVDEYSPDVLIEFQTGLQRAAALRVLGRYDQAEDQLEDLADNGNYEPWWGMVELERVNLAASRPGSETPADGAYALVDSLSPGKNYSVYAVYERGVRALRAGDYQTAQESFRKARAATAPFQRRAQYYSSLMDRYFEQTNKAANIHKGFEPTNFADSTKAQVSEAYYNTARVFAALDVPDSLLHYYDRSFHWAPEKGREAARVIYARAMMARDSGRTARADSLLEILVQNYELTDYAADARLRLGYTEAAKNDPSEDLYKSGRSFMMAGDNTRAMTQFKRVINEYPQSSYAPHAYYAIGLMFEEKYENIDSALSYYGRILELYPKSDQAATVITMLQAVNMQRMRSPVPGANGSSTTGTVEGSSGTGTVPNEQNTDWMNQPQQPGGLMPLDPRNPQDTKPPGSAKDGSMGAPRSLPVEQSGSGNFMFNPQGTDPVITPPPPAGDQQPNAPPAGGTQPPDGGQKDEVIKDDGKKDDGNAGKTPIGRRKRP